MPLPFITLQQHLPFTVLKRYARDISVRINEQLQQHLSSTVLKLFNIKWCTKRFKRVATVLTVHGIETIVLPRFWKYRLLVVATVPTVYGIETGRTVKFSIPKLLLQQ